MSELAKKIIGIHVEDVTRPNLPPLVRWLQFQCRYGALSEAVERFCAGQSEPLDPALVVVEQVNADCIRCVIPVRVIDHESPHPFSAEVRFLLNPATSLSERVAVVDESARGGS